MLGRYAWSSQKIFQFRICRISWRCGILLEWAFVQNQNWQLRIIAEIYVAAIAEDEKTDD